MTTGTANGTAVTKTAEQKIAENNAAIVELNAEVRNLEKRLGRAVKMQEADPDEEGAAIVADYTSQLADANKRVERLQAANVALENSERVREHVEPMIKRVGSLKVSGGLLDGFTVSLANLEKIAADVATAQGRADARARVVTAIVKAAQGLDAETLAAFPTLGFEPSDDGTSVILKTVTTRTRTGGGGGGGAKPSIVTKSPEGGVPVGTKIRGEGAAFASLAEMLKEKHPATAEKLTSSTSKARQSARVLAEGLGYAFEDAEQDATVAPAAEPAAV